MTSLIKALDTLTMLSSKDEAMTLPALAEAMNLPRTTLQRTLNTLTLYGLVEKQGRSYRVGRGFDQWACRDRQHYWVQRYHPVLKAIAEATGELVLLGVHEGNGIVHIDYIESDHSVRVAPAPHTRHPLELTAMGKLVLSRRPDLCAGLQRASLREELEEIQQTRVAWNREESVQGMIAMATIGFTDNPTEPVLAVAWPVHRFSEAKGEEALRMIRDVVAEQELHD